MPTNYTVLSASSQLSPVTQRNKGDPSHLKVVGCDDGNITCMDPSIHQRLDVQSDEANFAWGGETAVFSEGHAIQPL